MTGVAATLTPAASSGSFLVKPNVGLMVWTLILFALSMIALWKLAFPRISQALDRRQRAIEDSIDAAEQTRREIEAETRRAIDEIRREVADLTVTATEKVTRKVLDEEDQRRLVEEALSELDFSTLSASGE